MNKERLMKILLAPIRTEKSHRIADAHNQVVFKVLPSATKPEIKAAVKLLFNVEVIGVQVANVLGKKVRYRSRPGKRSDWKKAYVRLAEGQDIKLAAGEGA